MIILFGPQTHLLSFKLTCCALRQGTHLPPENIFLSGQVLHPVEITSWPVGHVQTLLFGV